ncbi:hypothetical protein GW17_00012368 [Ensete ventricosum]|nr:hypothetical protein GW17_00012368 [Ensete ventricosum]
MGSTYRSARLPKSTVGGRLSEKSTIGGRLRKKKGRRRGKEEKKEEGKKEYLASAVLVRLPSPPAGRLRVVAARGRGRFFSRARRQIEATRSVSSLGRKIAHGCGRRQRAGDGRGSVSSPLLFLFFFFFFFFPFSPISLNRPLTVDSPSIGRRRPKSIADGQFLAVLSGSRQSAYR